jgi:hypothetical protein
MELLVNVDTSCSIHRRDQICFKTFTVSQKETYRKDLGVDGGGGGGHYEREQPLGNTARIWTPYISLSIQLSGALL